MEKKKNLRASSATRAGKSHQLDKKKAWRSRKEDASCFYWACSCELTPIATFHAGSSGRSPNIQSQIDSLASLTQFTDPRPCIFAACSLVAGWLHSLAKRQTSAVFAARLNVGRANTDGMKCSENLTTAQRKKHRRNTRDCFFFSFP